MKLAFIENRYKTFFWEALAQEFIKDGHDVIWLVQNPVFTPASDRVYLMPFPKNIDVAGEVGGGFDRVKRADRNINYFSGNDSHYNHYYKIICNWVDSERPDVVVGESTLFHELMVIDACRKRNIPFLHPSMPGYPGGRYSIYVFDTKDTAGSNAELPLESECLALAEAIRKRERIPDYMQVVKAQDSEFKYHTPRSFMDRLTILRGYFAGERFNTPAPWVKVFLDLGVKRRLKRWQVLANNSTDLWQGKRIALYPLQMQPEANLDVWGQAYRDQAQLVAQLADVLPEGWHLRVKANPKPKYELSDTLLDILENHPKVSAVSLDETMGDVLEHTNLVCTVTGTVAVECVLSGIPLVQFGPGIVQSGAGCAMARNITEVRDVAAAVESGKFIIAADTDRVDLVRRLYATSFSGKVSDPMHLPSVMTKENVRMVAKSLMEVAVTYA